MGLGKRLFRILRDSRLENAARSGRTGTAAATRDADSDFEFAGWMIGALASAQTKRRVTSTGDRDDRR